MLFYAAASAGLVTLIKPLMDSVLSSRLDLTFAGVRVDLRTWSVAVLVDLFLQGPGRLLLDLPDDRRRAARGPRPARPAVPAHPESVGRLLQPPNERPAAVGHHERRPADPGGGVGDGRRPPSRGAVRRRVRVPDVLLRLQAGAGCRHRRADRRLSARAARPAGPADEPTGAGRARASVPHHDRGLHRPSHRQGVRRGGARGVALSARVRAPVSHQPEGDEHGLDAAAADGVPRRRRRRRADRLRQPQDRAPEA